MGGLKYPPSSEASVAEKIIHVDSPEVRQRYEQLMVSAAIDFQNKISSLEEKLQGSQIELIDARKRAIELEAKYEWQVKEFERRSQHSSRITKLEQAGEINELKRLRSDIHESHERELKLAHENEDLKAELWHLRNQVKTLTESGQVPLPPEVIIQYQTDWRIVVGFSGASAFLGGWIFHLIQVLT